MFQSYVSFHVKMTSTYNDRTSHVSSSVVFKVSLFRRCLLRRSHAAFALIGSRSGAREQDCLRALTLNFRGES